MINSDEMIISEFRASLKAKLHKNTCIISKLPAIRVFNDFMHIIDGYAVGYTYPFWRKDFIGNTPLMEGNERESKIEFLVEKSTCM